MYGGKLVIVNLQPTPIDHLAYLRINAKVDDVMEGVMQRLDLEIPKFELIRYAKLQYKKGNGFKLQGMQNDGSAFDIFKSLHGFEDESSTTWTLSFHANYGEPDLSIQIPADVLDGLR